MVRKKKQLPEVVSKSNLDNFLDGLLKEDNPAPPPVNTQEVAPVEAPQDVSLDQVVDRYLVRYEKESIPTADSYEDELYGEEVEHYSKVVEEALNEADDDELNLDDPAADEEDAGAEGDAGLDLGDDTGDAADTGPDAGGDGETTPAEPTVTATPQINLQDFARSVARLVNNYDELLKPRETILNRTKAYIASNYDERTAEELMGILDTNYSLRPSQEEEQENEFPTSYSVGALSTEG